MIHVIQYDYSRGDQTESDKRIGKATIYGPFGSRLEAEKFIDNELINDGNHECKMINIPGVGLI